MNSETLTPTRTKSAASTAVAPGSTALMDLGRTGRAAADTRKGPEDGLYFLSRHYLGGKKFSKRSLSSRSEVHAAIVSGASYGALLLLKIRSGPLIYLRIMIIAHPPDFW